MLKNIIILEYNIEMLLYLTILMRVNEIIMFNKMHA